MPEEKEQTGPITKSFPTAENSLFAILSKKPGSWPTPDESHADTLNASESEVLKNAIPASALEQNIRIKTAPKPTGWNDLGLVSQNGKSIKRGDKFLDVKHNKKVVVVVPYVGASESGSLLHEVVEFGKTKRYRLKEKYLKSIV